MQPEFISVDGARIRHVDSGGAGVPVVFVHGITGYLEDWAPVLPRLAEHHRVIALDLIGSGLSDKPDHLDYTQAQIARSILTFLDAKGVGAAHLVGYSSGGRQVLMAADMEPGRILSVTAAAPAGFADDTIINFRLASVPGLGELLTRPSAAATRMLMKAAVYDPSVLTDSLIAHKLEMARQPDAQRLFLRTLRGFVAFRGFRPEAVAEAQALLPRLPMPVLLIWGRNDRFLPFPHAAKVLDRLRNGRLIPYEHCGHLPQIEHPARFARDLTDFLRTVEGA